MFQSFLKAQMGFGIVQIKKEDSGYAFANSLKENNKSDIEEESEKK